jgi:NADH:ubiquinone reductase (H+-translocating)
MTPHVVIVGGGFGGMSAARTLRTRHVRVTLLDRHNYHLFQPLLYQVATAGLSPGDIASPIRWVLRRQRNVQVLLGTAVAVDAAARTLRLDEGSLPYDYLVLAAGSSHSYFGHEDWETYAPGLKTLDDALRMRRRMLLAFERAERAPGDAERRRLLTFVIVGGGPTGVELAGALAEIAQHTLANEYRSIETGTARIVLVEAGPHLLSMYPPGLRTAAERSLRRLGVEVRKNTPVTAVRPGTIEAGGETLEVGTVLWAAGVSASPLARTLAAPLDRVGRVEVRPDLSVPGHPEVFVVGDLAAFAQDGQLLPGVAQVAIQQGRHAAENIVRLSAGQPTRPFVYRDYGNMATIGRAAAIADFGRVRLSGWIAWVAWLGLHIVKLIGFRNRLGVMLQWAWAYFTYQRSVRLITDGPDSEERRTKNEEPRSPFSSALGVHLEVGVLLERVGRNEHPALPLREAQLGAPVRPGMPAGRDPGGHALRALAVAQRLSEIESLPGVEAGEPDAVGREPGAIARRAERLRGRRDDAEDGAVGQAEPVGGRPRGFVDGLDAAVPALEPPKHLVARHDPVGRPERGAGHVHVLDEAHLGVQSARELDQPLHLVVVQPPHDDGVDLQAAEQARRLDDARHHA